MTGNRTGVQCGRNTIISFLIPNLLFHQIDSSYCPLVHISPAHLSLNQIQMICCCLLFRCWVLATLICIVKFSIEMSGQDVNECLISGHDYGRIWYLTYEMCGETPVKTVKQKNNLSFGIVTINDFECIHLYKPAFPSSRHTVTSVCQHVRYLLPSSRKRVRATSCGYAMNVAMDLDTAPANINSKKSLIDRPSFGCVCLISACQREKQEENAS